MAKMVLMPMGYIYSKSSVLILPYEQLWSALKQLIQRSPYNERKWTTNLYK